MDTTETESKWASEGYAVERISKPAHLTTNPHSHPFDARVFILAGEFTLTSQGQSRVFYPEEHFEMPAGCLHSEHYGPEGAVFLIGRKHPAAGV